MGGKGRLILGSNTSTSDIPGNRIGTSTPYILNVADLLAEGLRADNPFLSDALPTDLQSTPYIAAVTGGAELYGLLENPLPGAGLFDDPRTETITEGPFTAPANALAAVLRLDLGPGPFAENYTGFDMLLFVNLSDIALSNPSIGVNESATDLLTGGFRTDPLFGGSGGPQDLNVLEPGAVWATLIPESEGLTLNASIGESVPGSIQDIVDKGLVVDTPLFITAVRPDLGVESDLRGFDAIAASPDGKQIYGVSSEQDGLVVVNTEDGSQRQLFKDGFAGVDGLAGASDVAISANGKQVYVVSTGDQKIALFYRDVNTGNLFFGGAVGERNGADVFRTVTVEPIPDSTLVLAGGTDGFAVYVGLAQFP
ncbi:MAG: hypothetical protein P8019_14980, partial [Gammaproteobacteria bacterium]